MDKRELRSVVRRIERIKTWQLVILLLMLAFIAATFLRLNNVGMVERRDAVYAADRAGDQVQLGQRIYDLQRYVSAHMNTDTGQIPLENTYKAVYDRELDKFQQGIASQSDNKVMSKIVEVCDAMAIAGGYGRFQANADPRYVACINDEWAKYPAAAEVSLEFSPPPTAPYYQTFVAPVWSPDFAGWSVLVCLVIVIIIIVRLATLGALKLMLSRQYDRL